MWGMSINVCKVIKEKSVRAVLSALFFHLAQNPLFSIAFPDRPFAPFCEASFVSF